MAESVFATLRTEFYYRRVWPTRDRATCEVGAGSRTANRGQGQLLKSVCWAAARRPSAGPTSPAPAISRRQEVT